VVERGQTGKGANLSLFGGANKACVAGGQTGRGCLFRTPFLWFISFGGAKEMNIIHKKRGFPFETPYSCSVIL